MTIDKGNDMKQIEIFGDNRLETFTKTRLAGRGIVVSDGDILLSYETKIDFWSIPGGGFEENETPEECCRREVEEETGFVVTPVLEYLILNEYYEEYCYTSHYFVCEVTGHRQMHLTENEKKNGAEPRWIPLTEAAEILSRHGEYGGIDENKRGSYLRDHTALLEYMQVKR